MRHQEGVKQTLDVRLAHRVLAVDIVLEVRREEREPIQMHVHEPLGDHEAVVRVGSEVVVEADVVGDAVRQDKILHSPHVAGDVPALTDMLSVNVVGRKALIINEKVKHVCLLFRCAHYIRFGRICQSFYANGQKTQMYK